LNACHFRSTASFKEILSRPGTCASYDEARPISLFINQTDSGTESLKNLNVLPRDYALATLTALGLRPDISQFVLLGKGASFRLDKQSPQDVPASLQVRQENKIQSKTVRLGTNNKINKLRLCNNYLVYKNVWEGK